MEPSPGTIIFGNIRGIFPDYNSYKCDYLHDLASDKNAGLIILTESHLHKNIHDDLISRDGWTVVRTDRVNRICGGVVCLVKDDFPIGGQLSFSTSYCEVLGIYLSSINVVNITVYRPPGCPLNHFIIAMNKIKSW